jgi:hypothetical protein
MDIDSVNLRCKANRPILNHISKTNHPGIPTWFLDFEKEDVLNMCTLEPMIDYGLTYTYCYGNLYIF